MIRHPKKEEGVSAVKLVQNLKSTSKRENTKSEFEAQFNLQSATREPAENDRYSMGAMEWCASGKPHRLSCYTDTLGMEFVCV